MLATALGLALCLGPITLATEDSSATATAAAPWFVAIGGQRSGPFNEQQIAADYLAGRIDDNTLAWREGDADWRPLAQTSGFAELDRWYVRQDARTLGPITGAEVRRMLDDARSEGRDLSKLTVRVEWSASWVALADAAPLAVATTPAPRVSTDIERPTDTTLADPGATERIRKLRLAGLVLVGVGGGLVVIGGGLAGGYSSGAIGAKGLWTGVALAGVGIGPAIAGFAMFGAANAKSRRLAARSKTARSLRASPIAGDGAIGMTMSGRF